VGAFFFANDVMPVANLKMRSLLYDIQQQRPELTIRPGIFDNTLEGYSIRIGDRDPRTNLLRDIWIYDHTDDQGNVSVTVADSGYMKMSADEKHLLLTLYDGRSYIELQDQKKENRHIKSYPHRRDRFDKQEMIIEMTGFGLNRTDERLFRNSYAMMNLSQLRHFDDSLSGDIDQLLYNINNTVEHTLKGKSKRILMKPPPPTRAPVDRAELRHAGMDITEIDSIMAQRQGADRPAPSPSAAKRRQANERQANNRETKVPAAEHPEAQNELIIKQIHVDSAFNELTTLEKRRAITQAINFARSNKSFISSNGGTAEWRITRLRRYQIEIHRKFTLSILCLIFFFIGAPLGAIIRKGGLGVPVIVSVLLFLIYYMISITGEKFVRENLMQPFWGMWISTFIMIPVSIFLTYKAVNDSVIMNIETYFIWSKNLRDRFFKLLRLA
jgi:lipopolysaccharide export system permease protein